MKRGKGGEGRDEPHVQLIVVAVVGTERRWGWVGAGGRGGGYGREGRVGAGGWTMDKACVGGAGEKVQDG